MTYLQNLYFLFHDRMLWWIRSLGSRAGIVSARSYNSDDIELEVKTFLWLLVSQALSQHAENKVTVMTSQD